MTEDSTQLSDNTTGDGKQRCPGNVSGLTHQDVTGQHVYACSVTVVAEHAGVAAGSA